MRVKTDARRQAILDAAAEVFCELGFERASMSAISERVGGSKATLYSYFQSKQELFVEVMLDALAEHAESVFDVLAPTADLRQTLKRFATGYLSLVLLPDVVAIRRMVFGDCGRSGLGKMLYERGPAKAWRQVAEFLKVQMDAGRLRQVEPLTAALNFKGMLESDLVERRMFGVIEDPSAADIDKAATDAADIFLRAYGLEAQATPADPGQLQPTDVAKAG